MNTFKSQAALCGGSMALSDPHAQAMPRGSSTAEMPPEGLSSIWISQHWCYQTLPELSRLITRPALLIVFCGLITHWQLELDFIPAPGQKMLTSSFTPQYLLRSQTALASRVLEFVRWRVHSKCIVAADTDLWAKQAMAAHHVQFYLCPLQQGALI